MSALTTAVNGAVRALVRLVLPEGVALALLLALPAFVPLGPIEPYVPLLLAAAVAAALAVGWRFRRGRMVFGALLVAASTLLPLLPPAAWLLGATLLPLNLALLAALPERGVLSGQGVAIAAALLAQGALLTWLAGAATALPPDLVLPGLGAVSLFWIGSVCALAALALLATDTAEGRDDALRRGLFWATAAVVAGQAGAGVATAGPDGWAVLAGTLVLLIAGVEEAHRLAYYDALTGLPSRRALDERLQRLTGRYAVAMVDIDHFKRFNDRHGHEVGDQVLRMVAARLARTRGARAFRYGGEEFTLLFQGRTVEAVRDDLEEVRRRIGDSPFVIRGADRPEKKPGRALSLWRKRQTLTVTVSLGAAQREGWRQPPDAVLREADQALYRAKKRGRNRVVA